MFSLFSKSKLSRKDNKTSPLPARPPHQIRCIGHRGMPCTYPENTLPSFQAALDSGADGIELDIRLTKDNEIVVLHDATLERSTTGRGFVSKWTWSELQLIQAKQTHLGYSECFPVNPIVDYTPPKGPAFAPIPRLLDVLQLILQQERKDLELIIDIKWDNPLAIMFHLKRLLELQDYETLLPRITLGIWSPIFIPFLLPLPVKKSFIGSNLYLARLFAFSVDTFSIEKDVLLANPTFIETYRSQLYFISTWTTDALLDIHKCMNVGVDAMIGDCVGLLVKIRAQIAQTSATSSTASLNNDPKDIDSTSPLRKAMISVKNYPKPTFAKLRYYFTFACLLFLFTSSYLLTWNIYFSQYYPHLDTAVG